MSNYFIKEEKIRFQHIDYAGIVFYPRFFEMLNGLVEDWFEEALDRPFSKMHDPRPSRTGQSQSNGIPTVDLKVQFKHPARLGETITKKLWVQHLGSASILCSFLFSNEQGKTVLEGEVTLVNVHITDDRNNIKAEPFNEDMKVKISKFLIPNS